MGLLALILGKQETTIAKLNENDEVIYGVAIDENIEIVHPARFNFKGVVNAGDKCSDGNGREWNPATGWKYTAAPKGRQARCGDGTEVDVDNVDVRGWGGT